MDSSSEDERSSEKIGGRKGYEKVPDTTYPNSNHHGGEEQKSLRGAFLMQRAPLPATAIRTPASSRWERNQKRAPLAFSEIKASEPLFPEECLLRCVNIATEPLGTEKNTPRTVGTREERHRNSIGQRQHILYGREKEMEALHEAFERCVSASSPGPEITLITGRSGSGKTGLAESLLPIVTERGGYWVGGKLESLEGLQVSYGPLVDAFTGWVNHVMSKDINKMPPGRLSEITQAVEPILTSDRLLTDLIPALRLFLPTDEDRLPLPAPTQAGGRQGVRKQLLLNMRRFVKAICSPIHPMVLFIDDLQWSEPALLEMLNALINDEEIVGLMVLGACRGNEVDLKHPLSVMLREKMEADPNSRITDIHVGSLNLGAVIELVNGNFAFDNPTQTRALSNWVHGRTKGNIFFILLLLQALVDDGIIFPLATQEKTGSRWSWKQHFSTPAGINVGFNSRLGSGSAMDLICHTIQQLPTSVVDLLKVASCLGQAFDERLLKILIDSTASESNIADDLVIAADNYLITKVGYGGRWGFPHDQIQQSAYDLIAPDEKGALHLRIGQTLWNSLDENELELNMDLVVNQLRLGAHLIDNQLDRYSMASLLLGAGERATASSKFLEAAKSFNMGIKLLGERHWRDEYLLSLALYNGAAEVEYCNGRFGRTENLLKAVLEHALSGHDKTRAYATMIYTLGTRNKCIEAIKLGSKALSEFGENLPAKPRKLKMGMDFVKTKKLLQKFSDDDILALPTLQDEDIRSIMHIYGSLFAYAFTHSPNHTPLIVMRVVQLTMKYGLSGFFAYQISFFGMLLVNWFGEVDLGLRCGKLALKMLEKFDCREYIARVYVGVYAFIEPYITPFTQQLAPLLEGHRVGLITGDVEFSMRCAVLYTSVAISTGSVHLPKLKEKLVSFTQLMLAHNQMNNIQFLHLTHQGVLNLMAQSNSTNILTGEIMKEIEFERLAKLQKDQSLFGVLLLHKLVLHSMVCNHHTALEAATALEKLPGATATFPLSAQSAWHLRTGISAAAGWQHKRSRRSVRIVKRARKRLLKLSERNPASFLSKVYLLDAELTRIYDKNNNVIMEKYGLAIAAAEKEGMLMEVGLANERAAEYLENMRLHPECRTYRKQAIDAYATWGAIHKVICLEARL